jgi:hypothetical protein
MKVLTVVLLSLLAACGALDEMMTREGTSPPKIYLGDSVVTIKATEADNYACLGSIMICERFGSKMRCRC